MATVFDLCNGCEIRSADPDSPAGYCLECEAGARRETATFEAKCRIHATIVATREQATLFETYPTGHGLDAAVVLKHRGEWASGLVAGDTIVQLRYWQDSRANASAAARRLSGSRS